jgi:gluconokinase
MAGSVPLTDGDRWDWLIKLRTEAVRQLESSDGVIVTCSALKHMYRDVLRVAHYHSPSIQVHIIYLRADRQTLLDRVANRKGHFMKKEMVNSQLNELQEPADDESDTIIVDVGGSLDESQQAALDAVKKKRSEYENLPHICECGCRQCLPQPIGT